MLQVRPNTKRGGEGWGWGGWGCCLLEAPYKKWAGGRVNGYEKWEGGGVRGGSLYERGHPPLYMLWQCASREKNTVLNFNDLSVTVQMIVAHFIHATSLNCIMYLCLQLCIS